MEKKNDKKFNWKKAAVIGGIFAAGVAVGVAGDKAYIKVMFKKHYQDILKDYRLRVDTGTTIKGEKGYHQHYRQDDRQDLWHYLVA
jgi:hypothetical protein